MFVESQPSVPGAQAVFGSERSQFPPHLHTILRDNKAACAKGLVLVVACNLKCTDGEASPSNAHEFLTLNTRNRISKRPN